MDTTGAPSDFLALARAEDGRLRGLAYRLLGGDRDRMDDTLLGAYRDASRRHPDLAPEAGAAWLYRAVYNACVDELLRQGEQPDPPPALAPDGDGAGPLGALRALPVDQRVSLVLVDAEGLPPRDAARILGVSPDRLDARLARARAAMDGHRLDAVAVPPHRATFWSELADPTAPDAPTEERASAEDDAQEDAREDAVAASPWSRPWARHAARVALTVVIVALFVLLGVLVARRGDGDGPDLHAGAPASAPAS